MKLRYLLCLWVFAFTGHAQIPGLPAGLGGASEVEPPDKGAGRDGGWAAAWPVEFSGFADFRVGGRMRNDPLQSDRSLAEARLHLRALFAGEMVTAQWAGDFVWDGLESSTPVSLESGGGFFDLREASVLLRPMASVDLKVGRQILTWGTGDLLFINDLFPKDWHSFFVGRDDEMLKAPSDAVRLAYYGTWLNVDLVYTPRFDSDRFVDGSRVSFFSPMANGLVGGGTIVDPLQPRAWFVDDEWALRFHRLFGSIETAIYLYDGFWKSPVGFDPLAGRPTFPRLSVLGASARGPLSRGLAHVELGYFFSRDDRLGDDPFIPNDELRFLIGYEQEIRPELTLGLQAYWEWMQEHSAYRATLPSGQREKEAVRNVLTFRLTRMALNQNLRLSLFAFVSPTERDGYLRPQVHYKLSDAWALGAGANIFRGENDRFFGQFEDASNFYFSARRGF